MHKSGFVAIIGKPNAGKSTLMNALLGVHLSIATHKAQTTRHRITGIYSDEESQIVFLDTPGIIQPKYKLQESMMRFVGQARDDADILLLLVDVNDAQFEPEFWETFNPTRKPVVLVLNKVDAAGEEHVVSTRNYLNKKASFAREVQVSALQKLGLAELIIQLKSLLLPGPPFYPKDELSVHPERFFVAELVREQLFLQYHEELPYSCAVNIVDYKEEGDLDRIEAEIVVNRNSQKGIIIGKGGSALKKLGIASRKSIEEFTGRRAHLQLFVKVREKWRDNDTFLKSYGY